MQRVLTFILALAMGAFAASIDGKWAAEFQMRNRGADAAAQARKVEVTLDLKSDGASLTGNVSMGRREAPIQDGKIEGDKFSFTTMQKTQDGEAKILWSGTVKGDAIEGARTREGAKRSVPFTAKRK